MLIKRVLTSACIFVSLSTAFTVAAQEYVAFTACPIARDVGPDADFCFFTEYNGEKYALTNPQDFGNAQLKHKVLVEGRVLDGPLVCGATPVEGRYSVMTELDLSCDQIAPFDGVIVGKSRNLFNRGSVEQQEKYKALMARAQLDPALSIQPVIYEPALPDAPEPPFSEQRLTLYFPFESDRSSTPDMVALLELIAYQQASSGRITLKAFQASSRLQSREVLEERAGTAKARAEKLLDILVGLGVEPSAISVSVAGRNVVGNGKDDWKNRRVELVMKPSEE